MPDAETYVRPGFRTITPYLTVRGAEAAIAFMVATFDAVVIRRDPHDDGTLMNTETNLGDSLLERSEARRVGRDAGCLARLRPGYRRDLPACPGGGWRRVLPPADMPHGERSAGVRDVAGNVWYLATYQGE